MRNLIHEIHRRSLWQVLGIYLAGSWVALQVVEQIQEATGMPEWIRPLALILFIVGLPIVLATAFVQEGLGRGPEKRDALDSGETTPEPSSGLAGRTGGVFTWRNAIAGGIVAFALLGILGTAWVVFGPGSLSGGSDASRDAGVGAKSIAVLPFTSVEEENESFRVGIHDALLTQLAKVSDLRVTSRTSTLEYENTTKSMPQIGGELGVAHLLEGSVQRAENVVQINVQLIDAAADAHLWAESYTRDLSAANLIAIQGEIVRDIARELQAALAPEEESRIAAVPTENIEAYDSFLVGRDLQRRGTRVARLAAVDAFQEAVDLDPSFAVAWAYLSMAHTDVYWYGYDRSESRAETARAAADRALELRPDLAEGRLALGELYYRYHRDYGAALRELEAARVQLGDTADLLTTLGSVWRRQGSFRRAVDAYLQAEQLAPRSAALPYNRGQTLWMVGEFEEAERAFRRALTLNPEHASAWTSLSRTAIYRTGDIGAAAEVLAQATVPSSEVAFWRSRLALMARQPERALEAMSLLPEVIPSQYGRLPRALLEGFAHSQAGESAVARASLEEARVMLEEFATNPADETARLYLAMAYAGLGRADEAREAAAAAREVLPPDEFLQGNWGGTLASVYASVGEQEAAVELLRTILDARLGLMALNLDPRWDPLRDHPGFQALAAAEQAKWDEAKTTP